MIHGRSSFPFGSNFFCLFFERFLETRPTFDRHPPRPITDVQMCIWAEMMPKRCHPQYPARISPKELQLLECEDNHMFIMVSCPYARMDWRQCPNILFTKVELADDRGSISVFFKLIYFHFSVLINENKI